MKSPWKMAGHQPSTGDQLISGAGTGDPWTNGLWRALIYRRATGSILLGFATALLPSMGAHRVLVGLAVALVGPAYHVGLNLSFNRRGRIPTFMAYTDVALVVVFPLFSATTFFPALLLLVGVIALSAVSVGTRPAILSTFIATAGMIVAAHLSDPAWGQVGIVIMAIVSMVAATTIGPVAANAVTMRARFSSLVEGIDGIVWEADPLTGHTFYVSPQVEALLGPSDDGEALRDRWRDRAHPDERERVDRIRQDALAAGRDYELQYRTIASDGAIHNLNESVRLTRHPGDGSLIAMHGITIDVSDQEDTLRQIRRYGDLVESINLGLVVLHQLDRGDPRSFVILASNPAACEALNRRLDEAIDQPLIDELPILATTDILHRAAEVVRSGEPFLLDAVVMRPGQPNEQILELRVFPLPHDAVGVSLADVTTSVRASEELKHQALHDGLTGLPNRNFLRTRLIESLTAAQTDGRSVALLVMDLDQFKEINDTLGHHIGDLLLHELGHRLRQLARNDDMVARLGGDEFAVLMTTDVSGKGAESMAKRIRAALLEPFTLGELRIQTNASIGIAVHPDHGNDADELTQRADVAMYQAKRTGTGHAVYNAALDHSSVRRLTLLSELRRALERQEFLLHFQPIISVGDGRSVRAEALVRWLHPVHGLLGPDEFIELAEVSGFIQPLTHWILSEAINCADRWWRAGHRVGLAVNLSVRNLYDPGLADHVAHALSGSVLPPEELMLEVTESELMDDPGLAMEVLGNINRMGVRAAVDDFGTGYSSLRYLRNLPVDEIKIDRSFVAGMATDPDDLTIVRSTIELGHNLGMTVVAEGVEDAESLSQLLALGCDMAQGFHIARPQRVEDFRHWLGHPSRPSATAPRSHPAPPSWSRRTHRT